MTFAQSALGKGVVAHLPGRQVAEIVLRTWAPVVGVGPVSGVVVTAAIRSGVSPGGAGWGFGEGSPITGVVVTNAIRSGPRWWVGDVG